MLIGFLLISYKIGVICIDTDYNSSMIKTLNQQIDRVEEVQENLCDTLTMDKEQPAPPKPMSKPKSTRKSKKTTKAKKK